MKEDGSIVCDGQHELYVYKVGVAGCEINACVGGLWSSRDFIVRLELSDIRSKRSCCLACGTLSACTLTRESQRGCLAAGNFLEVSPVSIKSNKIEEKQFIREEEKEMVVVAP